MSKRKRRNTAVAALLGGLGFFWLAPWRGWFIVGVDVPYYATERDVFGGILVRKELSGRGGLLIALAEGGNLWEALEDSDALAGPVYRFYPVSGQIEVSSVAAWDQAEGEIIGELGDCLEGRDSVYHDVLEHALNIAGRPVQTAASYVLNVGVSPDCEYVDTVSAHGRRRRGFFFFFGGGYPNGPYYHETFLQRTGEKIGPTYILNTPRGSVGTLGRCWDDGGNFIIYHDDQGRYLWVVPGPNHSSNSSESVDSQ